MSDIYSVEQYPAYKQQAMLEDAHRAQLVRAATGQHPRWQWRSALSRLTRGWFSSRQPIADELELSETTLPAPAIPNAQ